MSIIDDKQHNTATWLAAQLRESEPGPAAVWQLAGAVGAGKSSVLRLIREKLDGKFIPLMIAAPGDEADAAAIALLEMASQLKAADRMNGEMAILDDPSRPWREKMDAVVKAVDDNSEDVVILCDEPTRWYHREESLVDDTPDYAARTLAEWIAEQTSCRRIIAGRIPRDIPVPNRTKAPRLEDGRGFLGEYDRWGKIAPVADELQNNLSQALSFSSVWQMKLLVALARFKTASEVASQAAREISADVLLEELLDTVQNDSTAGTFKEALVRLAIARTSVDRQTVTALTPELSEMDRDLITACLCESDGDRIALHPLVRQAVNQPQRDPRNWDATIQWRISPEDRKTAHLRLQRAYALDNGTSLRHQLESFHHELLGGAGKLPEQDERLRFIEQLHEIGRTMSYVLRDHSRAADLFRLALRLDSKNPYSHHYLAFNLDWLAQQPEQVEAHYKEATELQPSHPWWWSRWISYLATRGQIQQARSKWREALDAMSVSQDDSPRWIFMSLHRWVARWLLHWAELDFAEEVLRSIPASVAESEASIQAMRDLLRGLREAERDAPVFPLSVPAKEWWAPMPHTNLPPRINGDQLHSWMPARIEVVDRENRHVSFLAARRPETRDGPVDFDEIRLTWEKVKAAAYKFRSTELTAGMYVEFAYYGSRKRMRIGLHRTTVLNDSRLLPLVPPPDRWYQRAVSNAWDSIRNERSAQ